jgi:small subunit ribosomal protein S6
VLQPNFIGRENIAVTHYETLFIVHPDKGPRVKEFIERFRKVIEGQAGIVSQVEEWGLRDLAYRIEKQGKGYYTLLQYRSAGRAVEELERNLRLTDGILRYLTVRDDEANQIDAQSSARSESEQADMSAAGDAKTDPQV